MAIQSGYRLYEEDELGQYHLLATFNSDFTEVEMANGKVVNYDLALPTTPDFDIVEDSLTPNTSYIRFLVAFDVDYNNGEEYGGRYINVTTLAYDDTESEDELVEQMTWHDYKYTNQRIQQLAYTHLTQDINIYQQTIYPILLPLNYIKQVTYTKTDLFDLGNMKQLIYSKNLAWDYHVYQASHTDNILSTIKPYVQQTTYNSTKDSNGIIKNTIRNAILTDFYLYQTAYTPMVNKSNGISQLTYNPVQAQKTNIYQMTHNPFDIKYNSSQVIWNKVVKDAYIAQGSYTLNALRQNWYAVQQLNFNPIEAKPMSWEDTIFTITYTAIPLQTDIIKVRIVTIGDSITAGHQGPNSTEIGYDPFVGGNIESQYAYWLQLRLGYDYEVVNKGTGRDDSNDLLKRLESDAIDLHPRYLISLIGTNDLYYAQFRNTNVEDALNNLKNNTMTIIDKCLANEVKPIICTLLPRNELRGEYRTALFTFNNWVKTYCTLNRIDYIDFFSLFDTSNLGTPGQFNMAYTFDGTHPSIKGYKLMANYINVGLFDSFRANLSMYKNAECTELEDQSVEGYNLTLPNQIRRGQTKILTRYLKNDGNVTVAFNLQYKNTSNQIIQLSYDGIEWHDSLVGVVYAGNVKPIKIKLSAPYEGRVWTPEMSLALRGFSK